MRSLLYSTIPNNVPRSLFRRLFWKRGIFTMRINAPSATIEVAGRGAITIEWGDGSRTVQALTSAPVNVSKNYGTSGSRIIAIRRANNITRLSLISASNFSFDVGQLPQYLEYFYADSGGITSGVSGNVANLPRNIRTFVLRDDNSIEGDLALAPRQLQFFDVRNCKISNYTKGRNWGATLDTFVLRPSSGYGLTSAEVDNLLIDLAKTINWTGDMMVDLTGANAAPTSASANAIAILNGYGVAVSVNS